VNRERRTFLKWIPALAGMGSLSIGALAQGRGSPRIVVIGGGFSGINFARALKRLLPAIEIVVIERQAEYTRCPGSNRVIAGFAPMASLTHRAAPTLIKEGIRWIQSSIQRIDTVQRRLQLEHGETLFYDRLVLAPGIDFQWDKVRGVSEHQSLDVPHAWRAGVQTVRLRDQIKAIPPGGVFMMTVPGNPYRCPPGPYERASLIAASLKRNNPRAKIIILDAKSKFSKEKGFKSAWASLYPGMIDWISLETEGEIDHIDPTTRTVQTAFHRYQADVLSVIPPQRAGSLAAQADLADETLWCPVNSMNFESTRVKGIHVIGDAASYGSIPKSAFAAQTEARACALSVALELGGLPLPNPRLINHCYSLIAEEKAISITGIYGPKSLGGAVETFGVMESTPEADHEKEYQETMDWFDLLVRSTFN
jgi:sulfide dehydrogenase [flavocytochrome c] flavoprotein chain